MKNSKLIIVIFYVAAARRTARPEMLMNISSVLVKTKIAYLQEVKTSLAKVPGVTVYFSDDEGRVIITIEGEHLDEEIALFQKVQNLPHVISTDLVNHYFVEDETPSSEDDLGIKPSYAVSDK